MTQADPRRRKALACIREGRVRIDRVIKEADDFYTRVSAVVRSSRDGHEYFIRLCGRKWSCDCREGRRDLPCAHTLAVALVTTGSTT